MSLPALVLAPNVVDVIAVPAAAKLGPNLRVRAAAGPLSTMGEVLGFPGPLTVTGAWTYGSARVQAASLPVIASATLGTSVTVVGVPGPPITAIAGDPRVLIV